MTLNPFKRLREHISDLNNTIFELRGSINYLTLAVEDLQKASRDANGEIKALAEYEQVKFVTTGLVLPKTKAVAVTQAEIDAEREREAQYNEFHAGFQSNLGIAKQSFAKSGRAYRDAMLDIAGGAR